ncbi:hypothetical protein MHYP_G00278570 [Metynnis hypsauchen]
MAESSSDEEGPATEMSGKHKTVQNQPGTKITVEERAGKPSQDPPPPQKLKCFKDILDIVHTLSDEEWRALTNDVPHARSKVEFATLCRNIVISVGKSAVKSFLPTLIHTVGMEAVLAAKEQLKKEAHSESRSPSGQSTTPTEPVASSHNSDRRSTVEPSEFISNMIEDFISEVKVAMQEATCKLASGKAPSFSESWKPKQSPVAEEMTNVLSELFKKSEHEDAPSTGREVHKAKQETDINNITGKIIVVVLDLMDGSSVRKADLRTSDLLNAAAEKIKHIISNSEDSIDKRTLLEQNKRQNAEELQAKATRAVSQVLLSTGVWEVNGGSPEMPSSLESEADLDSVLDAMAQSGLPTEMIRGHLKSTSREIVDTIVENMDMLSCHRMERSKSGFPSLITNIFQTINEKVEKFFQVSKQAVKQSSTEHLSDDDDLCLTKQTDVDSCTDKIIPNIVDSFKKEVPLDQSGSSEDHEASPSSDQNNDGIIDIQNQHEVSSSHSAPGLKEPEGNILTVEPERFLTKATQVVSDLLVKSDRCSASASTVSSKDLQDAAINITRTVVAALDELVDSTAIDSKSDSETIIRSLKASIHTLSGSDISEGRVPSTSFNLFRRVHGYLQALFMSLKNEDQTAASIQDARVSDLQLSRDHSVSQLDDLTVTCTNSIIGEIVQLYHSAESSESQKPAENEDSEVIYGIIQGLEILVRASSSSSESASSGRDLEERKDRSFSNLDSVLKADSVPNVASSIRSAESLLTDQFRGKAAQTVKDILLKSGGDFSTSLSIQSSEASSTADFQPCITESPSAAASFLSIKAGSTASDIMEMFLNRLRKYCLSSPLQKSFLSASRSIYRGVQKKVFGFFLGLRESFSAKVEPTKGAELASVTSPRFKVDLDSCADDVIVKIVELYQSELLLPKPNSSTLPQISHSMSLHSTFPCDHGIHEEENVNMICSSISKPTSVRMITVEPKGVVNEAVQEVSDISLKRAASKIAWDELSQCSLNSTRGTSGTPVLSESLTDSDSAAPVTADTLVDAIDKFIDQCSLATPVLTSTDLESAAVTIAETVVDALDFGCQTESIPLSSNTSDVKSYEKCTVWTKSTRSTTPESTPASAVSERSTNQENGVFFKKSNSAAEGITQPQFQQPSGTNQLPTLITDEPICFHEVGIRNLSLKLLGNMTGPSQACRSTSDSAIETYRLRDPIQVPLALVHPFVEESVRSLLLHSLGHSPALPNLISPDQQGTSIGFEGQSRNSDKSTEFQGVSTNAVSHFTKALADLVVKSLRSSCAVSDVKDDPLTLLVMPEQTDMARIHDISGIDFVSPSHLDRIASDVVRETLERFIISTQEGSSSCSSTSPFNDNCVLNPDPEVLKKSRGFRFNICKKAPVISFGFKKLKKVCPAGLLSADHPPNSSSGNLQESSQTESKDLVTQFKKARKHLSRIFSTISKALPNPLSCMTRPS